MKRPFERRLVWLINPYGPVPSEPWRVYTYALFLKHLAESGYRAIWFTASYSHHFKRQRIKGNESYGRRAKIFFIKGFGYNDNLSIMRYLRDLSFSFQIYLIFLSRRLSSRPDLIIFTDNPLCVFFGPASIAAIKTKNKKPKVVIHQMDQWHQLYRDYVISRVNKLFLPIAKALFRILNNARIRRLSYLDGTLALSTKYLNDLHRSQPILEKKPRCVIYNTSKSACNVNLKYKNNTSKISLVYAGSVGPNYDIETLFRVVALNSDIYSLNFATTSLDRLMNLEIPINVRVYESLSSEELHDLYLKSDIGIIPYKKWSNVEMPDKFYDYIHSGLAVVNSLKGEVATFISRSKCGLNYDSEDLESMSNALKFLMEPGVLHSARLASISLSKELSVEMQLQKLDNFVDTL